MRYFIDTANIKDIAETIEFFPVVGVTTNPALVAREKSDFVQLISGIRDVIGPERSLLVQTRGTTAEEIVKEAHLLQKLVGANYIAKIPMTRAGLKATMALSKEDFPCAMTAVCTTQQAMLAAQAGSKIVIPYVNRIDSIGGSGAEVSCDMAAMLDHYGLDCEVCAASFRNVQQITDCALGGCHAVTLKAELFDEIASHPLTDSGLAGFDKAWAEQYGSKKILDILK